MKAILIDATKKEVKEITITSDNEAMYKALNCECFCAGLNLPHDDKLFVDDEGLLKPNITKAFNFQDKFFAGNGLIIGIDSEGENRDYQAPIEVIKKLVTFPPDGWQLPEETRKKMTQMTVIYFN